MSSPSQRSYRPDEAIQTPADTAPESFPPLAPDAPPLRAEEFDPVWVAQTEVEQREAMTQQELDRLEQIITSENFRIRQRRFPNFAPAPPPPARQKRPGMRWTVGTFAFLLASSSLVTLYATGRLPLPEAWKETVAGQGTRIAAMLAPAQEASPPAEPSATEPPAKAAEPPANPEGAPRLVVNGASAENNEEILLGVAVEAPRDGLTAVVSGLAQGTTLSSGKPWGNTGWIVPASDLATTFLRPPAGFTGTMEYAVALQLPDGTAVDRQSMRLEWRPTETQPPAPPPASPAAASSPAAPAAAPPASPAAAPRATPPATAARNIDPQELAGMVKRGEELLANGDIASARLLLQRAAEARDARAAFALAASYDPIAMRRLGVYGASPNVTKARDWYEKARQYGSREAPQRLELLASQYR